MGSFTCNYKSFIGVSSIFWLILVSLRDVSGDDFLIDCGSLNITKLGNRVFLSDNFTSGFLSTSKIILAEANSTTVLPSSFDSNLYRSARIFEGVSQYTFPIKKHGRHWIRLYFFPFSFRNYNMSSAKFSVSAQKGTTLLKDFQFDSSLVRREYSLNISESQLVITFTPSSKSFAFINALEVVSIPDKVIPEHVTSVHPQGDDKNLWKQALETVHRVNMGNQPVSPLNDSLGRDWAPDGPFLIHINFANFTSNVTAVNFKAENMSGDIAPAEVYGTSTTLKVSDQDPRSRANMTWVFDVDPGFDYLVRFHFCDVVNLPPETLFNVYVNSGIVSTINVGTAMPFQGAPYYMDTITRISGSSDLNVSVGTPNLGDSISPVFLNGLEIMKMSNSEDSLVLDSKSSTEKKLGIKVAACVAGSVVIVLVVAMAVVLLYRRRRRNRLHVGHENGTDLSYMSGMDHSNIFSNSKIGYRFPCAVIQEATNNFSEDLVIGVGGFGKVYKGVFRDETKVAVKRGSSQSQQGLVEFRTEIEMLSQFRHRHLVSLIGYCHEQDERIIIYEYMENGTLKNHLYGSDDKPSLNWRQRLEACIGAAKGLHYLHTGSTKSIIHRDVKSANILLDENFMAKVADFGLSKAGPEIDKTHVSTAVKGSFGYLDPEYLTTQQLTEKSDVYSFGVVMFEVLCGRPVIDPSLPREKVNLIEWVKKCLERRNLKEIVDARLTDQIESDSLKKFVEIAEKCLAEHGSNRPTMGDVLWNLEYALRQEGIGRQSSPPVRQINHSDTGLSATEYTMGSLSGISDVSMSKVFAQMVSREEDMR